MRAFEIITEETSLSLSKLTKREGRVEKFLDLIKNKHTFDSKIGPVVVDPASINQLKKDIESNNSNTKVSILEPQKTILPLGSLSYNDAVFSAGKTGIQASKSGDTDLKIKPSAVFQHGTPEKEEELTTDLAINLGAFFAKDLNKKILTNEHLKTQGEAGQAVIDIVKQISQGQVPLIPKNLDKKKITSIQNDAFEYLGVLALIKGVAEFPNSEDFYNHVGENLENTVLLFPNATNNPLTDSYALTGKDGNTIFISSKGKSGAASSIGKLKIPKRLETEKDLSIQFLKIIQGTAAWKQPFDAANWINDNYPGTLGELEQFLPFNEDFLTYLADTFKLGRKKVPNNVKQIPEKYRPIFQAVKRDTKNSVHPLFYNIRNWVKTFIHEAVNSKKAVPSFTPKMLEVLGENFVVLKTKPIGGKFVTYVHWPSKMGGKIIFEHKDPADKWSASMTWKLI